MKTKHKTALIIGVNGQDGKILFDFLSSLNYGVVGVDKKSIKTFKIDWNKKVDINKKNDVFNLIKAIKPDEVYYLAAFHHSSQDKKIDFYDDLKMSYEINVLAFTNFLEAIRNFSSKTKIFYASSSLIFGNCKDKIQNEKTPFNPNNPYGLTKVNGMMLCRLYREKYNIFAAAGILYNHESEYRTENFISMKIIKSALNIKRGMQKELVIGNFGAVVDWGYAPDYVRAMHSMLALKNADDFVIATGKSHSVLDFIKVTFNHLNLDWRQYIQENKDIIIEKRSVLIGDYKKLSSKTNWKPSVSFSEMIKKIIDQVS
jgi:GDPmannose 4,6-dehydratase